MDSYSESFNSLNLSISKVFYKLINFLWVSLFYLGFKLKFIVLKIFFFYGVYEFDLLELKLKLLIFKFLFDFGVFSLLIKFIFD